MEEWMQEKRLQGWLKIMGGLTVLIGIVNSVLMVNAYRQTWSQLSPLQSRLAIFFIMVLGLSMILCGVIIWLMAKAAAFADNNGPLVVRACSLYLFMVMCGMLVIGRSGPFVYFLLLACAINLVGLCPFCNKSRRALFTPPTESSGGEK